MDQITEYKQSYQEYKAELDTELSKAAEGFVRIGFLLKVARDTDVLKESGYASVTEFAAAEYTLDKTKVSRFIHINDRFSEGGCSDHLEDKYRGFGYAKLTLMLQLPEEITEELTPDYSKADIQAIKDEVDAEHRITDIEVALEGETETTAVMEDDLGKTVKQLGEDDPQLYADIWKSIRQQDWSIEQLQTILAPNGQKVYSVRIRGVGRKEMLLRDKDNGNEIVLIDLRGSGKKRYTWEDMQQVWEAITVAEPETGYKGAWESVYFASWPLKDQVAPVQQEKRKQSKVKKAKTSTQQEAAVVQQSEQQEPEEQLPGQMNVNDYPGVVPVTYEEIKEETENATDGNKSAPEGDGGEDSANPGDARGIKEQVHSEIQDGSNEADDVNGVSGGLGTAEDAGTSGEVSRTELEDCIEKAWDSLFKAVHEMINVNYGRHATQNAYNRSIDMAAALERLIMLRQKEVEMGQNG